MRVKEVAELAGTSVRTVRYYHQVGLLDIPAERDGFRDYDLQHLARLLRIRWMVGAGLSLPVIGEILDDENGASAGPLADLRRTLAAMDQQLADLQAQRERIVSLIDRAETYPSVTPLPAGLSRFYDRVAKRMPTSRARLALEAERRILSILAIRGYLPVGLEKLTSEMTTEDEDLVIAMFTSFAEARRGDDGAADQHIADLLAFTERHEDCLLSLLNELSGRQAAAFRLLGRLVTLAYPARAQARVLDRYVEELQKNPRLMAALAEGEWVR